MLASLYYRTIRLYVKTVLWFFFRKWQMHGMENIPKNAAVIYVVNHQNAFQDAILIACGGTDEPWFLTRAGVFNNKFVHALLRLFHMMPVYRFRDGVRGLRNNDITIRQCIDLLNERKSILLFGEGDQGMRYQLRTLQKGFGRIALMTQQENDWKLPLYIVPVGIQYDHYYNFRSRVLINYGKAIPIDASMQSLPEREFYDSLLQKTTEGLLPLMLHIENENYEAIESYLHQNRDKKDLVEQLKHDQAIIADWKNSPRVTIPKTTNYFLLILGLPLHLYAWINNIFPYLLTSWILKKYVNKEFKGSLKVGFGMVIVPLFYLGQSIIVHSIFSDWRITIGYALTLPFLSTWSVDLFKSARRTLL
ncbi:MAG TPA: 1-acyl-sn-glycerol-3-phosphate acyltransferase [Cyclobacteriaceae bacterium]|nr:1-acyl-sn-glycerol-3-phosphate acyltransferase [Cyclobacteriaceae bacterium]